LLRQIGVPFAVAPPEISEAEIELADPAETAERRSWAKAEAVAAARSHAGLVIGADTVVVVDGTALGKPGDAEEARAMLERLSGRSHLVISGLAVLDGSAGTGKVIHEVSVVTFRRLSPSTIDAYVATGEPLDKAGAYGVQGKGAALVERVEGCYFNVVGLPLARLTTLLADFGVDVPSLWQR